jgi:hypothetical protein
MALIDITPVMTSNTTPTPYVVTASSVYGAGYEEYRAFNNVLGTDKWVTNASVTGWIKLDFGSEKQIDAFSVYSALATNAPKTFILYGSLDDINYEQIIKIDSQLTWGTATVAEGRLYRLDNSVSFRYYRLNIIENNGYTNSAIAEIKFWQDDGVQTYITNKTANMESCLPNSTTLSIKSKKNDPRVGRLGYANDDTNFGTLWLVNKIGESQLARAAMANYDILFDGTANATGTYTLASSLSKYKYILITLYSNSNRNTLLIQVDEFIKSTSANPTIVGMVAGNASNAWISLYYASNTSFTISAVMLTGYSSLYISKIVGII